MAVFLRADVLLLLLTMMMMMMMMKMKSTAADQSCSENFTVGSSDFIVNTAEAVNAGAVYLSNPGVYTEEQCRSACCGNVRCNLAVVEREHGEGTTSSCFLFDCVHRGQYVCSFMKKPGFNNYILREVFDQYLSSPSTGREDRPPIAKAGPDMVVRMGEKVTLNGNESWDDHKKITEFEWKMLRGNNSVHTEKTSFPDQLVLSNLYPGVYEFQLTVKDSAGQFGSTSIRILVLTPEQAERHCLVPKKVGPCRGSFRRWHYNAASNRCEEFIFGGCAPNRNNYLTLQECNDACNGTKAAVEGRKIKFAPEVCGSAACADGQWRCANGCCVDAEFECDGQTHCSDGSDEEACPHLNRTLTRLLDIRVNEAKVRCVDPPMTGPCRASFSRWYYDPLERICHRFTFGGCDGNKNNFESKDECMDFCRGVTESDVFAKGLFERSEQGEHHSGSVATAVILAVLILALLALLGFCFLKKKKRETQRQRVPTTAPVAEDTDHLVYKPTTT